MDLTLSILEKSDLTALVLTDTTVGWGTGGNVAITAIDNVSHTLHLDVKKKTLTGTVVYDTINLYTDADFGGPWTSQSDLVFTITPMKLLVDGAVESGVTADSTIEDAVYTFTYTLDEGLGTELSVEVVVLAYNDIKTKVYTKLRQVHPIYNAYDFRSKEISDTLLQYSLLKSIEAMAYVALEDELVEMLDTIQKINTNGSNYTWQ